MARNGSPVIAMIGAGGATFGTLMIYEALRCPGLEGAELALIDIDAERLEVTRAAGARMNESLGGKLRISADTDTARGIAGADFILLSVESGRWAHWKQDLDVPRKYGSLQDMAENGGPGGVFHALRTVTLVLDICKIIEANNPDALLINVTNPLPRVNHAITTATKLNCIGDCPEFRLGLLRLARFLMLPPKKIAPRAWGMNHFTWIHELRHADTGADLYPALDRHVRLLPFMHGKLARRCYADFGLYPVSSDSHIGEYLPSDGPGTRSVLPRWFPYQKFSETECRLRVQLSKWYGEGKFQLPFSILPAAIEGVMQLVEALATGADAEFGAVNVTNNGAIPNMPPWAIVEAPARTSAGKLIPETVPPITDPIAEHMNVQYKIHSLITESVLSRNPAPAFEAFCIDPLAPPTRDACRRAFDELLALQKERLPF